MRETRETSAGRVTSVNDNLFLDETREREREITDLVVDDSLRNKRRSLSASEAIVVASLRSIEREEITRSSSSLQR